MAASPLLKASFAGSCYPSDPRELLAHFNKAVKSSPKPKVRSLRSKAYLLPHIDFRVNLNIYGEVYRMISERSVFPELFVILGVGHNCPHEFSLCPFTFQTPLGKIQTDEELYLYIQEDCPFPVTRSPATFRGEHSLEFVIIWLQAIRDLYFPGKVFQVLPVLMGGLHDSLAEGSLPGRESEFYLFGQTLKKHSSGKESVVIASIDGCHVGPRFDHDFAGNLKAQEIVKAWEKKLWSLCRSDKQDAFFAHAARIQNAFYFDGLGVLSLLLQHFELKASVQTRDLWYEASDQSFVTFSGGWFDKQDPVGTQ